MHEIKIGKLDFIKIKHSLRERQCQRIRQATELEKIFVKYITDKRLYPDIERTLTTQQLKKKKEKISLRIPQNGQNPEH